MDYFTKVRLEIERDADARIETAQAILAEAEAHKATVLALLAETRAELVQDLATVQTKFHAYTASVGEPVPAFKFTPQVWIK